ncbi:hypothetical protein GCM10027447_14720 [Glycomyces halotolerans]
MFYWNDEMDRYESVIGAISPMGRLRLAIEAVSWTSATMSPPIQDADAQQFIASALDLAREGAQRGEVYPQMPPELETAFDRLLDAPEPGAGSLVMAAGSLFTAGDDEMPPQVAFNILWSCYEAVILREFDEPTPELEAQSGRCLEVIEHEKSLIDQAA